MLVKPRKTLHLFANKIEFSNRIKSLQKQALGNEAISNNAEDSFFRIVFLITNNSSRRLITFSSSGVGWLSATNNSSPTADVLAGESSDDDVNWFKVMDLIFWIFVGGIVGWIILMTSTGDHQNIYLNVLVGIAGGLIIGCLMPSYLSIDAPNDGGFDFQALGSLIVGAMAILSIASLFMSRDSR